MVSEHDILDGIALRLARGARAPRPRLAASPATVRRTASRSTRTRRRAWRAPRAERPRPRRPGRARRRAAGPARGWSRGGRRWRGSSARRSATGLLGPAGARPRPGRRADRRRRPGARRARRQPHRADVHRRPQRRLALRRAAGGRAWPTSRRRRTSATGWRCTDVRVAAAVRCAPPANKPTPEERDTCSPWLARELALLPAAAGGRRARRLRLDGAVAGARRRRATRCPGRGRRSGTAWRWSCRAARPAHPARLLPRQPAEHVHRPAHRADARRRPRPGGGAGSDRRMTATGRGPRP